MNQSHGHDNVINHNKRRHRSSPHRTVRKHRQTCTAGTSHTHQRSSLVTASSPRAACSAPAPPEPADEELEELETGYNSGDEYVPPKHPENIEEVG